MRFSIDVGSELELKMYQAVLLYKNDHGNRYMVTVHGVVQKNGDGSPVLGAGQLLSTASLRELARQLGTGCPVEFLPDEVVARTPDLLAWWTPAAVRPMFFRAGSELEGVSGKRFPHPALLLSLIHICSAAGRLLCETCGAQPRTPSMRATSGSEVLWRGQ